MKILLLDQAILGELLGIYIIIILDIVYLWFILVSEG